MIAMPLFKSLESEGGSSAMAEQEPMEQASQRGKTQRPQKSQAAMDRKGNRIFMGGISIGRVGKRYRVYSRTVHFPDIEDRSYPSSPEGGASVKRVVPTSEQSPLKPCRNILFGPTGESIVSTEVTVPINLE